MEIIEQRVGMTPGSATRAPWLLLHGAYGDASAWQSVQASCDERGIASRAISLPGHGTSTMHKGDLEHYSIRDYVRIVLSELEHATPKPVLVGYGLGAWLALRAAEECELPGVVLIGCPSLGGTLGKALGVLARHPLWVAGNLSSGFESPWVGAEAIAESLFGGPPPSGKESRCALRELLLKPIAFPEKVTAPSLVVRCESDALVTAQSSKQLAARLEAASSASIPGAAHDVLDSRWTGNLVEVIEKWTSKLG